MNNIIRTENALNDYMKAKGEFSDANNNVIANQIEAADCYQKGARFTNTDTSSLVSFSGDTADCKKWFVASAAKQEIDRIKNQLISGDLNDWRDTIDLLMDVLLRFIDTVQKLEKTLPQKSFLKKYFSRPELGRIQNCLEYFGWIKMPQL